MDDDEDDDEHGQHKSWREKISSREGWQNIGMTYVME